MQDLYLTGFTAAVVVVVVVVVVVGDCVDVDFCADAFGVFGAFVVGVVVGQLSAGELVFLVTIRAIATPSKATIITPKIPAINFQLILKRSFANGADKFVVDTVAKNEIKNGVST